MQIQKINQSSPNFGMAMIIEKSARPAIEKGGRSLLSKIQKAGEIVGGTRIIDGKEVDNSTKLVHLIIGEGAIPTVKTPYANQYTKYFEPQRLSEVYPEFLTIETIWAGRPSGNLKTGDIYNAAIKFEDAAAAQKAYRQLKEANSNIERGAILTRILDDKYIAENEKTVKVMKEREAFKIDLDDLFKQYGRKDA